MNIRIFLTFVFFFYFRVSGECITTFLMFLTSSVVILTIWWEMNEGRSGKWEKKKKRFNEHFLFLAAPPYLVAILLAFFFFLSFKFCFLMFSCPYSTSLSTWATHTSWVPFILSLSWSLIFKISVWHVKTESISHAWWNHRSLLIGSNYSQFQTLCEDCLKERRKWKKMRYF